MSQPTSILCIYCGNSDTGIYCSKCGEPLAANESLFIKVLKRHMIDYGYEDAESGLPGIYDPKLKALASCLHTMQSEVDGVVGVLLFDRSNKKQIEVAILIDTDSIEPEKIPEIRYRLWERLKPIAEILNKNSIQTLNFRFVSIFNAKTTSFRLFTPDRVNHLTINLGRSVSIKSYFFDIFLPKRGIFGKPISNDIGFTDVARKALKQIDYVYETKEKENIGQLIYINFIEEPIKKFGEIIRMSTDVFIRPMYYAHEISRGKIKLNNGFLSIGLMAFYAVFFENIFGDKIITSYLPGIPIIDELIPFFIFLGFILIGTVISYLLIRIMGGKGTFQKTFIMFSILSVPYFILSETMFSIYEKITPSNSGPSLAKQEQVVRNMMQSTFFLYLIPTLSLIHKIPTRRVTLILAIGFPIIVLGVSIPVIAFYDKQTGNVAFANYNYNHWSTIGSANVIFYSEGAVTQNDLSAVNDSLEAVGIFIPNANDSSARSVRLIKAADSTIRFSFTVKRNFELKKGQIFKPELVYGFHIIQGKVQQAIPYRKVSLDIINDSNKLIEEFPELVYVAGKKHMLFYDPSNVKETNVQRVADNMLKINFLTDAQPRGIMVKKLKNTYQLYEVVNAEYNNRTLQDIFRVDVSRLQSLMPKNRITMHLCGISFEDVKFDVP